METTRTVRDIIADLRTAADAYAILHGIKPVAGASEENPFRAVMADLGAFVIDVRYGDVTPEAIFDFTSEQQAKCAWAGDASPVYDLYDVLTAHA